VWLGCRSKYISPKRICNATFCPRFCQVSEGQAFSRGFDNRISLPKSTSYDISALNASRHWAARHRHAWTRECMRTTVWIRKGQPPQTPVFTTDNWYHFSKARFPLFDNYPQFWFHCRRYLVTVSTFVGYRRIRNMNAAPDSIVRERCITKERRKLK